MMLKTILTTLLLASSACACPNLTGLFQYAGKTTLEISQSTDLAGVTSFKVRIDDNTCAPCHSDKILKADGQVVEKPYGRAKDTTKIYCEGDRLKFRETTEYFNEKGLLIYTEKTQLDYRINWKNHLAIETIESDTPVSKVVYPRIN